MGFWSSAFDLAKNAGTAFHNHIEQEANEIREIRDRLEQLDDKELLKILNSEGFFGKSSREKSIAFSTLKSRGYNVDDIKKWSPIKHFFIF